MKTYFGLSAIIAFCVGLWVTQHVVSDIQIIIVGIAFLAAHVCLAVAIILEKLNAILKWQTMVSKNAVEGKPIG